MSPATRNDGLRLQSSGTDVASFRIVGALPGVVVLAAAARNGIGSGRIQASGDGTFLAWMAPNSQTFGVPQACGVAGVYMLEDGEDQSKWVRVQTYPAYLTPGAEALIFFADTYNAIGPDDVSAANALAGLVETVTFTLLNVTSNAIFAAKLWLDGATPSSLSISLDGTNFFQPMSESDVNVLQWSQIAPGASVTVWVRRSIGAAAVSAVKILNLLQYAWNGI